MTKKHSGYRPVAELGQLVAADEGIKLGLRARLKVGRGEDVEHVAVVITQCAGGNKGLSKTRLHSVVKGAHSPFDAG